MKRDEVSRCREATRWFLGLIGLLIFARCKNHVASKNEEIL